MGPDRSQYPRLRSHNKTTTGCWTCRSRRVKCGEEKPACQRCIRFGVACAGYEPRIAWASTSTSPAAPGTTDTPRRSRRFGHSLVPAGLDADACPPGSTRSENNLFSVFSAASSVLSPASTGTRGAPSPADRGATTTGPDDYHQDRQTSQHQSGGSLTSHASPSINNNGINTEHRRPATRLPSPARTHLDMLRVPAAQKRLIHHWVTFTSTKLVLVDEPHNPCRTMMLPMALRGLMSGADSSTADIATFHALCACAAYNLHNLHGLDGNSSSSNDGNNDHRSLALYHDQEAIHHLRHNLGQADQHHDQSFAMAIMACITIDAISGSTGRWRAHVTGGLAYLSRLRARGVSTDVLAAFQAHMVSMAILCGCAVPEELKDFLYAAQSLELTFPYYGASSSFLRHQDRMNMILAAQEGGSGGGGGGGGGGGDAIDDTADISDANSNINNNGDDELDALELQLYLDFPAARPPPPPPPPPPTPHPQQQQQQQQQQTTTTTTPRPPGPTIPPTHAMMLHHMAQAFYYASLVFCQRCVRKAHPSSVQALVDTGVRQLEAIEAVSGGSAGSVMMWPALVLGAECASDELQGRMLAWFEAKRKLGFRNIVVLQRLVQTLWADRRRRSRGGEEGGEEVERAGGGGGGGAVGVGGVARGEDVSGAKGEGSGWLDVICQEEFDVFRL